MREILHVIGAALLGAFAGYQWSQLLKLIVAMIVCVIATATVATADVNDGIYCPPYPIVVHSIPREKLEFATPYYVIINGQPHNTPASHLTAEHGYTPEQLAGLNYDQINRIHGWEHTNHAAKQAAAVKAAPAAAPQYQMQRVCNGRSCYWIKVQINK